MESIIPQAEREQIIALMKREVVPAIGCTEPIAVALCTAKAAETLGCKPEHINVYLSANILKNAMGVGIPGTGMIGLPIAIALGALIGKSEYQLEVLKDCTPEAVEEGKFTIWAVDDVTDALPLLLNLVWDGEGQTTLMQTIQERIAQASQQEGRHRFPWPLRWLNWFIPN